MCTRAKLLLFLGLVAMAIALAASANAEPFVNPPELYAPGWQTPFPYQRNVYLGFDVNPVGSTGSGIPGAVYEGYLDPNLKVSDYVTLTGAAHWYDTLPGVNKTGFIGIDNRSGNSTLVGYVDIRLDNTTEPNVVKHLWTEWEGLYYPGSGVGMSQNVVSPPDNELWQICGIVNAYSIGDNFYRADLGFQKSPNPTEETLMYGFYVPAGQIFVLDNLHIATECVPEPTTLGLLGVGVIGLLAYAWRRRK
jgi:hypothetical protein